MVKPYRISYSIEGADDLFTVTVSPNPASSYLRFALATGKVFDAGTLVNCFLYDAKGNVVLWKEMNAPYSERIEWYESLDPIPGGVYVYRAEVAAAGGLWFEETGKVVIAR